MPGPTQKVTITCSAEDLNAKLSKAQKELGLTHDDDQGVGGVFQDGLQDRGQQNDDQHIWERIYDVHDPHHNQVRPASRVSGYGPVDDADDQDQDGGE